MSEAAEVRDRAVAALAKDWNRAKAEQVLDYLNARPEAKAAVVAYLAQPDTTERDKIVADIRRRLPIVAVGYPELADYIGSAFDRLFGPSRG